MEVGWTGSAPYFIYMHHTYIFTAPAHLFFDFSLYFVFVVRDDLARLYAIRLLT